jgi:hypothetical protein
MPALLQGNAVGLAQHGMLFDYMMCVIPAAQPLQQHCRAHLVDALAGGPSTSVSQPSGSTPAAAAAAAGATLDLELWTQDGTTHSMCVRPGTTTAGDVRCMAAEKTGTPVAEVCSAAATASKSGVWFACIELLLLSTLLIQHMQQLCWL